MKKNNKQFELQCIYRFIPVFSKVSFGHISFVVQLCSRNIFMATKIISSLQSLYGSESKWESWDHEFET